LAQPRNPTGLQSLSPFHIASPQFFLSRKCKPSLAQRPPTHPVGEFPAQTPAFGPPFFPACCAELFHFFPGCRSATFFPPVFFSALTCSLPRKIYEIFIGSLEKTLAEAPFTTFESRVLARVRCRPPNFPPQGVFVPELSPPQSAFLSNRLRKRWARKSPQLENQQTGPAPPFSEKKKIPSRIGFWGSCPPPEPGLSNLPKKISAFFPFLFFLSRQKPAP